MAYLQIDDLKLGVDRRKARVNGVPGSLWSLVNAHLTRGGEVERCKAFVPVYALPPDTHGMLAIRDVLYVFGSVPAPAVPAGVTYQRLQHPDGTTAMARVLDAEAFSGLPYVIAEFVNGDVHHYYNGALVTDWIELTKDVLTNADIATALLGQIDAAGAFTVSAPAAAQIKVTGKTLGESFSYQSGVREIGPSTGATLTAITVVPPVAPVAAVRATIEFRCVRRHTSNSAYECRSINVTTDEGVADLLDYVNAGGLGAGNPNPVVWLTGDTASQFAAKVVARINANTAAGLAHGFSASAVGDVVKIHAPASYGAVANAFTVAYVHTGVTLSALDGGAPPTKFAGGVTGVTGTYMEVTFAVGGTFNRSAEYWIKLDGAEFAQRPFSADPGTTVLAFRSKLYSSAASLVYFSSIRNPMSWVGGIGAGYIAVSDQDAGSEEVTAIGAYQGKLAFFSRSTVQLWSIVEDEEQNSLITTLRSTGTRSPRSVVEYGGQNTYFLDSGGVRSIRSRDQIDTPAVSDVGDPINPLVQQHMAGLTDTEITRAVAAVEPRDGRLWMAIGSKIYVLSYFPMSKISAWSIYEPGFAPSEMAVAGSRLFLRSGDTIYCYGGLAGTTWPAAGELPVTVEFPFLSAGKPATHKVFTGLDVALTGTWLVELLHDPAREAVKVTVGTLAQTTYGDGRVAVNFVSTHVAPRFVCTTAGPATLSSLSIHYIDPHEAG